MSTGYIHSRTPTHGLPVDHEDKQVMGPLVTAGAYVALADGRLEPVERDELVSFIYRQGFVPASQDEIAEAFDSVVQELEEPDSLSVILKAFRPLAGLSLASVVVRTAERVAAADGEIRLSELQAVKLIRLLMMSLPNKRPPPDFVLRDA
jgi:tellurite resistance protein